MSTAPQHVPGRPVTASDDKCPFCLKNGMLKGEMLVETDHSYAVLVAEDLVLICPKDHLTGRLTRTVFASEYFELVEIALAMLGWKNSNDGRNNGDVAGQRLPHVHYKLKRRDSGLTSSGLGLDALIAKVDGKM